MDKYKKASALANEPEIPTGLLPVLVERMVQLDDLKALENNTLELWRALARYELQKESEAREAKLEEQRAFSELQHQNELLRQRLAVREAVANATTVHPVPCRCCHYGCDSGAML